MLSIFGRKPIRDLKFAGAILAVSTMGTASMAVAETDYEWPKYFNVSTLVVGSATHSIGVAWTSKFSADTGVRARPLPAPNVASRLTWLQTGETRLGMVQPEEYFSQMNVEEPFTTPVTCDVPTLRI